MKNCYNPSSNICSILFESCKVNIKLTNEQKKFLIFHERLHEDYLKQHPPIKEFNKKIWNIRK